MYRAYVGNLDSRVTEETLYSLFEEHDLGPSNVVLKRGYAFVDCPDQILLDKAIDELNGEYSCTARLTLSVRVMRLWNTADLVLIGVFF